MSNAEVQADVLVARFEEAFGYPSWLETSAEREAWERQRGEAWLFTLQAIAVTRPEGWRSLIFWLNRKSPLAEKRAKK